ncbi:hypothetical protein [Desulfosoma sp.]|uniref:hypothetical protein n=1 Tax=Desulfosoma sp. TaxID=2603217 RepID=UPI00404B74BA
MKRLLCVAMTLALVLGIGMAYAEDARVPQEFQAQYEQETGAKAAFFIWFPIAPQLKTPGWQNILILSNAANIPIQVQCWFTSFARTQTVKPYSLGQFEKKIFFLEDELGSKDEVYDIFCGSSNIFGAGLLLLEKGAIVTAWPPVVFF